MTGFLLVWMLWPALHLALAAVAAVAVGALILYAPADDEGCRYEARRCRR